MEALSEYLVGERIALREDLAATMAENALVDQRRRGGGAANGAGDEDPSGGMGPRIESTLGEVYQRKITPSDKETAVTDPWGAALGLAALAEAPGTSVEVAAAEDEADPLRRAVDEAAAAARAGARQELIVVASLVDRLPNLAGLARTCEVFRASRLVLADSRVTKDPQFASISVSAEHWVPIEEVAPVALEPWLRRKAAEGFTLVGLEQTAESARLQDYAFSTKTVLLLGAEREGVPADLLRLLDATVEIPQLGVIRSLNVHVSAAIGIYEFTRQRLAAAAARVLADGSGV
jgi:tRNA guanosine-2'-O-methyltransferase